MAQQNVLMLSLALWLFTYGDVATARDLAEVHSDVAACDFTALTAVPGVITYKGAKMQLLGLPYISDGTNDGKDRSCQVIAVAQTCHLVLMVLNALRSLGRKTIENELEGFGTRLNSQPPHIGCKKKDGEGPLISGPLAVIVSWIWKL